MAVKHEECAEDMIVSPVPNWRFIAENNGFLRGALGE